MTKGKNAEYQTKTVVMYLLAILLLCGAMKLTGGAGFVVLILVLIGALAKNSMRGIFFCLLLTGVVTFTNSFIAPKDMVFSFANRIVYLLASVVLGLKALTVRRSPLLTPFFALFGYCAYMGVVSSAGWAPLISYLKLFLFVVTTIAFFSVAKIYIVEEERASGLRNIVLAIALFWVLGSLCLIPFPGIAKVGAQQAIEQGLPVSAMGLFTGITNSPQALGPLLAAMSAILFADLLFVLKRWDAIYIAVLLGIPVLIYYSSSRTAMGTYLVGMFFVVMCFLFSRQLHSTWKAKAMTVLFGVFLVGGVCFVVSPQIREATARFALKYVAKDAKLEITSENLLKTRQGLMDEALENFSESPVIGNGFQVSKVMEQREINDISDFLSAPIEKGVWITAILEEGGIIGFMLFLIFLILAFSTLLSRGAVSASAVLIVLVVSNFGEFSMFSMTGMGGIMWALVFTALVLDAARIRDNRRARVWRGQVFSPWVNGAAWQVPYPAYSAGPIRAEVSYER